MKSIQGLAKKNTPIDKFIGIVYIGPRAPSERFAGRFFTKSKSEDSDENPMAF